MTRSRFLLMHSSGKKLSNNLYCDICVQRITGKILQLLQLKSWTELDGIWPGYSCRLHENLESNRKWRSRYEWSIRP